MAKSDVYSKAASSMSGKSKSSSKGKESGKTVKSMHIEHAANGGHVVTHSHGPEHEDEKHVMPNKASLMAHIAANTPDDGSMATPGASPTPDMSAAAPGAGPAASPAAAPAAGPAAPAPSAAAISPTPGM